MYKIAAILLILYFAGIVCADFIYIDPRDFTSQQNEYLSRIAATSGKISVTFAEIESTVNQLLRDNPRDNEHKSSFELRKEALEEILFQRLLAKQFEKLEITVEEYEIDAKIEQIAQDNQISLPQLISHIARIGIDYDTYRNNIANLIKTDKTAELLAGDELVVSDEQIEQYYLQNKSDFRQQEQIRLSHILVKISPDADQKDKAAAKIIIDTIRQRAINGEVFDFLAMKYSDSTSAQIGGDLGYATKRMLIPSLADIIFDMPEFKISRVKESEFGYHIIVVTDRKEEVQFSLEQVRDRIKNRLKEIKTENFLQQFKQTLLAQSEIAYYFEFAQD